MSLLSKISKPQDLKHFQEEQLESLAEEIRTRLIEVTSRNGGHIGPNLGVVELTIALHRVFDSPVDKFVFDVSHQGYVHKLLTGRNHQGFDNIRRTGGLSGFLNRSESEHDAFGAGHAGTTWERMSILLPFSGMQHSPAVSRWRRSIIFRKPRTG